MNVHCSHPMAVARIVSLPSPSGGLLDTLIAHRAQLQRVASRILNSPHLAEEVVEDAALKLCEAEGLMEAESPLAFLHRLVRNLAIDRARRLKRERLIAAPIEEAERIAMPCACPLETLEQREALAAVMKALDALPLRTRQVFLLHRIDGVPQKDLAEALGVSRTLVNFMIRDATRACRESVACACDAAQARCPLRARPGHRRGAGRMAA